MIHCPKQGAKTKMVLLILRMWATCTLEFCYQILGVTTDVPETDDSIWKESSLEEASGSGMTEEMPIEMKQKEPKGRALLVMGMKQIMSLLSPSPEQWTKNETKENYL